MALVNDFVVRVPAGTVRKVYRGYEWIWTNNTGYVLPPGQAVLVTNGLEPNAATSISRAILCSNLLRTTCRLSRLKSPCSHWPLHILEGTSTAVCVVAPGVALDMPAIAATRNNITVAQNSAGLQAVWDGEQGRLLAGENVISG